MVQVLSQVLSLTNWEAVSDLKWGRYAAHMLYALLVDSMLPSTPSTGDAQDASSVEKRASLPLPTWMNPQFLTTLSTTPGFVPIIFSALFLDVGGIPSVDLLPFSL